MSVSDLYGDDLYYECLTHFVHLDQANAAIHCAEVRFSPITFRLAEQLAGSKYKKAEHVRVVLDHKSQYEEDRGR